ncbi:uncharacterized protein MYCFIDRAFT_212699 [Pseudocercospora fijiensis CIRAD86]|uniref:Uncharacterized protein n=1 Tax=Pseudocercospora fijiensis (strain CIRAD86) TaxID=383855 RepID=M2ZE76_PSEFD|nr:uncharacterized protein MYCFIDRAFT_212699 [Pseudocercospora fijiensis CIRAD86]EME77429.1 hypothetical protein MYCFIDRAFT_212699 [Pseudocercospora fijiensis CIRAD86]
MSEADVASQRPTSFLDLPGEIRNKIYSYFIAHGYVDIAKIPSISELRSLHDHPLTKVHAQISLEWKRLSIQSAIFLIHHGSAGIFQKAGSREVLTHHDGGSAWVKWFGNLKEDEALWLRRLVFYMPALVLKVGINEEGVTNDFHLRLPKKEFEEVQWSGVEPMDRIIDESEANRRLSGAFEDISSRSEDGKSWSRKQAIEAIFWTVVEMQIWVDSRYALIHATSRGSFG